MGLKWASQLITKIWKINYVYWIHRSNLNHAGEALNNHTKEMILDAKITDEHERCQDTLPYHYIPYVGTSLSTILDTLITAIKHRYRLIKTAQ